MANSTENLRRLTPEAVELLENAPSITMEELENLYDPGDTKEVRSEFFKRNKISFGKYFCKRGVPCIELVQPDGKKVYLSAFRRYAFQVSGTRDGDWDLGSTPVFGLETLATIRQTGCSNLSQDSTELYITSACAMDAVHQYCSRNNYCAPENKFMGIFGNQEWIKFLEETVKFAHHLEVEKVELEEEEE